MMKNMDAADIIALVMIIGCFALKAIGINSTMNYILVTVASFYFGYKMRHVTVNNSFGGKRS